MVGPFFDRFAINSSQRACSSKLLKSLPSLDQHFIKYIGFTQRGVILILMTMKSYTILLIDGHHHKCRVKMYFTNPTVPPIFHSSMIPGGADGSVS